MWVGRGTTTLGLLGVLIVLPPTGSGRAAEPPGNLTGMAVVTGHVPRPILLPVTKHRSVCGDSKPSEGFVVSRDGGLGNVVVTIEGVPGPFPEPGKLAVLNNADCVFMPHVQVVRLGQVLEIRNSDRVIHTAHAYDETKGTLFNVALPVYKRSVHRTLTRAGYFRINCDVGHTWMSAYIVVVGHPYVTMTDGSGGFRFSGVPAGSYRLRFWHERLGAREEPVVIRPGSETTVILTLDAGRGAARVPDLPSSVGANTFR